MEEKEGTNVLLNFLIDEIKELRSDIKRIESSIITKEYCQTMQENCPAKNVESIAEKKTILV